MKQLIPIPEGCNPENVAGSEWTIINTPYLDPSNDVLQIYVKSGDHGFVLADMTDCEGYLWMSGLSIRKMPKLRKFIDLILRCDGIADGEFGLSLVTKDESREEFLKAYHTLIQAMITIQSYVLYRRVYAK